MDSAWMLRKRLELPIQIMKINLFILNWTSWENGYWSKEYKRWDIKSVKLGNNEASLRHSEHD